MSVQSSSQDQYAANLRDRILAERHRRMVDSAGRRLAQELYTFGCPAPRSELARRCGVDHWSQATLDEAVSAAERDGLVRSLPLGWIAPVNSLGAARRPRQESGIRPPLDRSGLPLIGKGRRPTLGRS
jgi:hypothetical protein